EFAFQRCTWASTIMRLPAGCDRADCALAATAAPAASAAPNSRRVIMMILAPSLSECSKRSPDERSDIRDQLRTRGIAARDARAASSNTLPWRGRVGEHRRREPGWG